ncbi:type VI secretion system lipoprotein TssJ [Enterobacteriaceae bacterium RIT691]|nr:type VI secretion system lipoprotein TssJ [Enterobacteriaceae bacterium RIT691]
MLNITSTCRFKYLLPALVLTLAGCGLTQSVSDSISSATKSLLFKQIKTLHLDIAARSVLNTDSQEADPSPEAVMVRVYQLKDRGSFDKASYEQLVHEGDTQLATDLLASHSLVITPGSAKPLDVPMNKEANYVAIVGLFRAPDIEQNSWRLVLKRDELDADKPRTIELSTHTLKLLPEEK